MRRGGPRSRSQPALLPGTGSAWTCCGTGTLRATGRILFDAPNPRVRAAFLGDAGVSPTTTAQPRQPQAGRYPRSPETRTPPGNVGSRSEPPPQTDRVDEICHTPPSRGSRRLKRRPGPILRPGRVRRMPSALLPEWAMRLLSSADAVRGIGWFALSEGHDRGFRKPAGNLRDQPMYWWRAVDALNQQDRLGDRRVETSRR